MKIFRFVLASTILAVSFLAGTAASPAVLNLLAHAPQDTSQNLVVPSPISSRTLAVKIDIIPLTGTAIVPTPNNAVIGAVYTTIFLRSTDNYEFRFAFSPEGTFRSVTKAHLWILSGDCYTCADQIDFSVAINGVVTSASAFSPGLSTQGPVTSAVVFPSNATSAITPGVNELTFDLIQATILSSGVVLTDIVFGIYQMSLFIEYQTT